MSAARDRESDNPPRFDRVQRRRSFEEIYDQVRREIAVGRLTPGDRLPSERDMATAFGVSRQAVRDAMRQLEISGLVTSRVGAGGGAFIERGDPGVVARGLNDLAFLGRLSQGSLLEARVLLISDAIRLACARGTEEDFDELQRDIDVTEALAAEGDLTARNEQVVNFYRILGRATHNDVYALLVDALTEIQQMRLRVVGHRPRPDLEKVRAEILADMRRRDAGAAVAKMVAHLERLEPILLEDEKEFAQKLDVSTDGAGG
jgi:GntR family transcriptional regulator, transcriptional repressor for pyruvate dehydrogenase complex